MPFVPVPKDLNRVKTKIALNLTKRQLICFSIAGAIGVPVYILTRTTIGNSAAVLVMIGLMLPFFFLAMYEKDGQPAEKILRNIIRSRLFFPSKRAYKTENFYTTIQKEQEPDEVSGGAVLKSSRVQSTISAPFFSEKKIQKEVTPIVNQNKTTGTARKTSTTKRKTSKK